jgi:tyrosyl-tRNA synthetase
MTFDILQELKTRNLISQTTDEVELKKYLDSGMSTFYIGFDPTAPSLHVGSLAQLLTMRRFQMAGHRPLALVGGATGLIGDPKQSGERNMNSTEIVEEWVSRVHSQVEKYFDFTGDNACVVVNNYDWTKNISAIELLRDYGKHFSVNRMLDREAVAARLAGPGISYTEFSYVILQSLDYLELNRRFGCALQLGGSDQWGNITAGCELVRRMDGKSVHAITTPLIQKADGTKFGKTESGTIWLDPEMTSPYAFYQFWLNTDDRDLPTFLHTYSFKSTTEIAEIISQSAESPHLRIGQRALADEITELVHSAAAAKAAAQAGKALFGQAELAELDAVTLEAALSEAGLVKLSKTDMVEGQIPSIVDLFVLAGISPSRGAARRAVEEGGAYLNNTKQTDPEALISPDQLLAGQFLVLRRGKKTMAGVKFELV